MTPTDPQDQAPSPNDQPTVLQEPGALSVRAGPPVVAPAHNPDAAPTLSGAGTGPQPLSRIGEYEILSTIGRGGMGVVFKARHVRLGRVVALKMLSGGLLARPEDVHRFEIEAAAAAQLQHPNIVALYEVGTYEDQPFFSMEFVHGSSLAGRVLFGPLPGRLAASYLERVARAVHYAHSRGIIHRDLKPANILLDEADEPKITDFGLAKLTAGDSGQTRTGTVMGTPSYMAPEQANARKDIGPACDIYSLGAILYELITGRPPFQGESALETLRRVAEDEPVAPRLLNPHVDRDLETICLKCLEKEPGRRYATAAALADDLRHYLGGEPITARRLGVAGRTVKWVQRQPATAALLFVTVAALVGFAGFEWHNADQEHRLRQEAEHLRLLADEQRQIAEKEKKEVLAHDVISRHYLYVAEMGQAQRAWENADLHRALVLLGGWQPGGEKKKDLRQWEWYFLQSLCQGPRALPGHFPHRASAVAYRPDGKRLATAGGPVNTKGQVKIWDAATGKLLTTLPEKHTGPITALAYSPDGQLLATAGWDHTVRLWDPDSGKDLAVLKGHKGAVSSVAFSHDGRLLASAGADGDVLVWDLSEPGAYPRRHTLHGHAGEVSGLAFHPTNDTLASAGFDETVRLWDADKGTLLHTLRGHQGEVRSVAFSPKGDVLYSGGGPSQLGGQLKCWDVANGKILQTHDGLSDRVLCVAVGKGGQFAAGCKDGYVFLWDEHRSTEPLRFRADTRPVYQLTFRPDGGRLATAGGSGRVRVWNSTGGTETLLLPAHARNDCLTFSPLGRLLAVAGRGADHDGSVYLFDAKTGVRTDMLQGHTGNVHTVAFSPDEKWLASGGEDQTVRLYDLAKGGPGRVLRGHQGRVMAVAFSPDGATLATAAAEDEEIILWNVADGTEQARLKGHRIGVLALAFSPNGHYLASGGSDKIVRVWDMSNNTSQSLTGHSKAIEALAFSPDSSQVASAGSDQTILIWNIGKNEVFQRLEGTAGPVAALAWHPRGQRLASVGLDRTVRLWDLITGREILQLQGPSGALRTVAISPDGWQLAAAGDYPYVHIWDARPASGD
jgi:WD40 repeat protein